MLREALVRKIGTASLPPPEVLTGTNLTQKGLDATLVSIEGKLIGIHAERRSPVLEMQSSGQLFVARIKGGAPVQLSLRVGSQIHLVGVYVRRSGDGRSKPLRYYLILRSIFTFSPSLRGGPFSVWRVWWARF